MKNKKLTQRRLIAELRKRNLELETQSAREYHAIRRGEAYEAAYRDLKNNLGQYLAMFANDIGVDCERAQKLQEAMFKEPQIAAFGYKQNMNPSWIVSDLK